VVLAGGGGVGAGFAVDLVFAGAAIHMVVAVADEEFVLAFVAEEIVGLHAAMDHVVTFITGCSVSGGGKVADQHDAVVASAAGYRAARRAIGAVGGNDIVAAVAFVNDSAAT